MWANTSAGGGMSPDFLRQLTPMKDALSSFEIETTLARQALGEVLHNDEDMLAMLLTEKRKLGEGEELDMSQHVQVELMLEDLYSQLTEVSQEAYYLRKKVEGTQSIIELQLDARTRRQPRSFGPHLGSIIKNTFADFLRILNRFHGLYHFLGHCPRPRTLLSPSAC